MRRLRAPGILGLHHKLMSRSFAVGSLRPGAHPSFELRLQQGELIGTELFLAADGHMRHLSRYRSSSGGFFRGFQDTLHKTFPSVWPALRLRRSFRHHLFQFQQASPHRALPTALLDAGLFIEGSGLELAPSAILGELALQQAESFVQLLVYHPHHHDLPLSPRPGAHRQTPNPALMRRTFSPISADVVAPPVVADAS